MASSDRCATTDPTADGTAAAGWPVALPRRGPIAMAPIRASATAHAVPGRTHLEGTRLTTALPLPGGPGWVEVDLAARDGHPVAWVSSADDAAAAHAALTRWLGLADDPAAVARTLGRDPLLAPLVERWPGLRVMGCLDGAECAVEAILGQQVSLAAARTFAARLVAALGRDAGRGLRTMPDAATLAAAGAARIRDITNLTRPRAAAVHALARAVADGLRLDPPLDVAATRAALLELPGIGPWTADYIALRALGDRDAFPVGDLVLRRALGGLDARAMAARAEAWRPWRAHAAVHLWTGHSYLAPTPPDGGRR